jgi:hypothetical protein
VQKSILSCFLRVCFILRFTQVWNHHPYNLALSGSLGGRTFEAHTVRSDVTQDRVIAAAGKPIGWRRSA